MTRIAEAPEGLSFYVAATSSRLVGCGPGLGRGAPVPAGLANRCLVDYDARARRSRPTRLALSRIALRDDHRPWGENPHWRFGHNRVVVPVRTLEKAPPHAPASVRLRGFGAAAELRPGPGSRPRRA